jgi:plasmid stabilization system protein ParE
VAIEQAVDSCARDPRLGIATEATGTFRYPLTRHSYTIFYRVIADRDEVEIVRVIHAARVKDLGRLPED